MIGSLVTKRGKELLAQAVATGKNLKLSEVRFSDYAGDINENMDILVGVKHTQPLTNKIIDPLNQDTIILETLLPANVGGFYIETLGVYTETGELFALVRIKQTYKSHIVETIPTDIQVKIHIQVSNVSNITLAIDESIVLASREYVNSIKESFSTSQRTQDAEIGKLKQTIQNLDVYQKSETYTKNEIDTSQQVQDEKIAALESNKADKTQLNDYYTKTESNSLLNAKVDTNTYITGQNAQNTRLTNLENSRALKIDLNNYYTKTETYTKAEVDTKDMQTSKVALKSTRNSSGIWTITNLVVGKPLIITASSSAATSGHNGFSYSVLNGTLDAATNSTGSIVFSCVTQWDNNFYGNMSSSSFTIIPAETSVSIKMNMLSNTTARAYQ